MTAPSPASTPDTRPSLLIVTMGLDSVAPARMQRELRAAGFAVTLLAPSQAIAASTRFVDKVGFFPEKPTLFDWITTVAGAVRAVRPAMILPGDEVSLRVLSQIAVAPPPGLRPELQQELAALITASMGDPANYLASIDKTRTLALARAAGVRVPPGEAVATEDDAARVAADVGFPVILRPAYGTASRGVARCGSADDVRRAFRSLRAPSGWAPPSGHVALVQRFVSGEQLNRPSLAWRGRQVAGVTRMGVRFYPETFGPSSVSRYVVHPESAAMSDRLIAALGATGYLSIQYVVDGATGETHLVEINRRMTPATHTARRVGVDLAAALAACVAGRAWPGPADLPESQQRTLALFPQEWLRDPSSPFLEEYPNDAPWDDPRLFEAMLKLPEAARARAGEATDSPRA